MVRTYKRKTERATNETNVSKALQDIRNKTETISSAARKYNIRRTTLRERFKKYTKKTVADSGNKSSNDEGTVVNFSSTFSTRQVLTSEQENDLTVYFEKCSALQFGLTRVMALKFVYQYVVKNQIKHPPSWDEKEMAGCDWLLGFMHRNTTLSLRKPENVSLARATGFNATAVQFFYLNLENVYKRFDFPPSRIYNLDETGINTATIQTPKVFFFKL